MIGMSNMTDRTEKQVIIFVRGEQFYTDMDPDKMELMTEGSMSIGAGGEIVLEYQESELTGMEGTTTCFIQEGEQITLTRTGTVNNHMVFREGRQHSSLYETPWGSILVDVATTTLASRLSERGGVLEVRYTIAVDHRVTGENRFRIRVRERAT